MNERQLRKNFGVFSEYVCTVKMNLSINIKNTVISFIESKHFMWFIDDLLFMWNNLSYSKWPTCKNDLFLTVLRFKILKRVFLVTLELEMKDFKALKLTGQWIYFSLTSLKIKSIVTYHSLTSNFKKIILHFKYFIEFSR